ncbi:hypothetical protein CGCTS75_v013859 [Colletotrichum tropicale]|nr:hypothetical protein CGCTS75_v013859 [Colletotrichum tropicale]
MTTALPLDHVALRCGTPAEVAQYLRGVRASTTDPAPITTQLHDAVAQGSIPHAVFALWTPLHRDARSTVAGLQQSESLLERKTAIKAFVKATRSAVTMDEIWNVAGGTPGIATLMSNLSTDEIKLLCNGLAKTASLCGSRPERHARLTELVELLLSQENPDPRPLQMCYKSILPACMTKKVAEHEESCPSWSQRQQAILLRAHSALYETRFLDTLLSAETDDVDFNAWKQLVNNNPGFAKDVLSKVLEADGALPMKPDDFVKLAEDITKPLHRRRSSTEKNLALEILKDLVAIFEKHSDLTEYLNVEPNGVLLNVVKFWEHARSTRPRIQRHLVKLIGLVHESYFKSAKNVTDMVRSVHPAVSYRLFRLTIQSSIYHSFDIEEVADVSKASFKKLKGPWPADLFTAFADDDADASLRLFRKLISTFPESQFLICSSLYRCSIVESAREPETDKGDPYILEAFLVHASSREATSSGSNTSNLVKQRLQDCKDNAARARDWVFRQGWATIALNLSVATGSFDVFADTIVWARRFNKDPNAVKQLYSYNNFPTIEATDLLSGIPSFPFRLETPKTGIKQSVESGNKILMQLLETAVMALRVPSFQQYDWSCITSFPEKVIERRLVGANKLQRAPHSLSDDEVFDFLWKPTIEFLIEAEKYLLQPNMERLYPREIKGLIHSIDFDFANNLRPHSARFLNTLSQERDKLWKEYRPRHFPAVHDLETLWPRGLPVQYLCPRGVASARDLPYVCGRIEAVVFGTPDILLREPPTDTELRDAIGPCIEDYCYALKTYVNTASDASERDTRIRKAWRHAIDNLSGDQMTKSESLDYWSYTFSSRANVKLPLDVESEVPGRLQPALPDVDDPDLPTEWNPYLQSDGILWDKGPNSGREIPANILTQMIHHGGPWFAPTIVDNQSPWDDGVWLEPPTHTWNFWPMKSDLPVSWTTKDAYAVALLLYLNTREGADSSILKSSFPSKDIVRFPAMFLDQDWLDNVGSYDFEVYDGSTDLVMFAPVSLVAQVAQSVLRDVEEKESFHPNAVKPMDLAMQLVRLLAGSDRPSLALPLIQKIVLGRPDDSAWHRELLNKGLFSKLSPTDTKTFLLSIADGILDNLDQQDARNKEQAEQSTGGSDRKTPLVKVTTVKMLAKLLSDSPFLDPKTSLTMLSHLLDKARHIDIRVAIIESLYGALGSSAASGVKDDILILLAKHALPLAAGFNERGPAWASWEEVEAGEPMPTVSAISGDNVVRQIFATWDYRFTDDLDLRKKMAALSLQVIEESAKNHRQWLEHFLKKHNLTLSSEEKLFNTPVDTGILALFGRNPEFLTHSVFEMIKDSVLTQICPPPGIAAINKKVRRDTGLSDSNAGQHWLSIFGKDTAVVRQTGAFPLLTRMHHPINRTAPDFSDSVTVELLQQFAREVFDSLVRSGDVDFLEEVFRSMTPTDNNEDNVESLARWKLITLPILEEVIAKIAKLRTLEWQKDLKREPARLPDTFRLNSALVVFPVNDDEEEIFMKDVMRLIEELAQMKGPYHKKWGYFKTKSMKPCRDRRRRMFRLANRLGSLNGVDLDSPSLPDQLRVELAAFLLDKGRPFVAKDPDVVAGLKAMLREWAESPIEEFRTSAMEIVDGFKKAGNDDWFTTGGGLDWVQIETDDSESEEDVE